MLSDNLVSCIFFKPFSARAPRRHYSCWIQQKDSVVTLGVHEHAENTLIPQLRAEHQACIADAGCHSRSEMGDGHVELQEGFFDDDVVVLPPANPTLNRLYGSASCVDTDFLVGGPGVGRTAL